jgi:phenylalanyl-tRNA synthetase beta chain
MLLGKVKLVKGFEPRIEKRMLTLSKEDVKSLLGIDVEKRKIVSILKQFGFVVQSRNKEISVEIPFYRLDVISKVDLIDEILRAIGANSIQEERPKSFNIGKYLPEHKIIDAIRKLMFALGFQEVNTSFLSSKLYQQDISGEEGIKTINGDYLRKHIYPELIRFLQNNKEKGKPYYFFDIGYVVEKEENLDVKYKNRLMLSFLIADEKQNVGYGLAVAKEILLNIFNMSINIKQEDIPGFIPGRSGSIVMNDKKIGIIGELHPKWLRALGLYMPITVCEIQLDSYAAL